MKGTEDNDCYYFSMIQRFYHSQFDYFVSRYDAKL